MGRAFQCFQVGGAAENRELIQLVPNKALQWWRCPDDGHSQLSRKGLWPCPSVWYFLNTLCIGGKSYPDLELTSPFPWKSWHAIQFCNFPTCCQSALLIYWLHTSWWSSYCCFLIGSPYSKIHRAKGWSRACLGTFVPKLSSFYTCNFHAKGSDIPEQSCLAFWLGVQL